MIIICPWCDATVTGAPPKCPECSFDLAESLTTAKKQKRREGFGSRRFWMILASLLVVAVVVTAFYFSTDVLEETSIAVTSPRYADPHMERVWIAGQAVVRAHLRQPTYDHFDRSSVIISAGGLASFCGYFEFPEPFGGSYVKRFISFEGRNWGAVMEYQTASFDVTWERLCLQHQGSW